MRACYGYICQLRVCDADCSQMRGACHGIVIRGVNRICLAQTPEIMPCQRLRLHGASQEP